MALAKQAVNLNFSQGIDRKTDPKQIRFGKFFRMENSVFTTEGLLSKRNGYGALAALPDSSSTSLTTFNGDLTAIGTSLRAYSSGTSQWVNKGAITPVQIDTIPVIRNNVNQSQCDSATASNGLTCFAYTESDGTTTSFKYAVIDSVTGQNIVAPTALPSAATSNAFPRVFMLGGYFVIIYPGSASHTLLRFAISTSSPTTTLSALDITGASFDTALSTVSFDGVVANNRLYVAWRGASAAGVELTYLNNTSVTPITPVVIDAAHTSTNYFSLCADTSQTVPSIWIAYYTVSGTNAYAVCVDQNINVVLSAHSLLGAVSGVVNLTTAASGGVLTALFEIQNDYSYDSSIHTNYVYYVTLTQGGSSGGAARVVLRSVGLASKAFASAGVIYFLAVYGSQYQPTYFLTELVPTNSVPVGQIVAKLAYQNGSYSSAGAGYLPNGLPSISLSGTTAQMAYLIKDLIQAVNKGTNPSPPSGTQTAGIYTQTGINLASFEIGTQTISAEIGQNLNLTGGFLYGYDGYSAVENGFFLYPDSVEKTATATTGGSMIPQQYFWQVTYEWSDNQGNQFRSAPSIPITFTVPAGTNTNTVTLSIPTLRLTYKTANPVKIVVYRWSNAQQTYFQTTSITSPLMNDVTADSVTFVDKNADTTIIGNNILYTTGGVVENIGGPAFKSAFIFDDRLFGITAEDQNLIWYSKQVLEGTPVEMSDLFTLYVAPSIGAQGPTGPLNCGAQMDDKLILFKSSAISYINGTGPDNTGANSQYSQPIFITSTVGCSNQNSIVFTPMGLMFEFATESGNAIWLLGRDLSTKYIGADVERLTKNATVQSAVNVPGTNQVRFTLSSGITVVYDYYYGQWGTFVGVPAISSCLYGGLHAYLNSLGQVFQETPDVYLDGSNPVLMALTTSWLSFAGLQGYQRAYMFYLLGTYLSPHKLVLQVGYDFQSAPSQQFVIQPNNFTPNFGGDPTFGAGDYFGGGGDIERWRVGLVQQRCESLQLSIQEVYDPAYGVAAGGGLTLSGINFVYGLKKGYRPMRATESAG